MKVQLNQPLRSCALTLLLIFLVVSCPTVAQSRSLTFTQHSNLQGNEMKEPRRQLMGRLTYQGNPPPSPSANRVKNMLPPGIQF